MTDGLMDPATPTLASGAAPAAPPAAPPAADPGEFGPAVTPATAPKTFEQRRHAQEQAVAADKPPATTDPQQAPPADGTKFKVGKFEVSEGEIAAMMDRQAQDDLRKATIPPAPQDYKLALPESLKLPGDAQFKFDEAGNKATFDAAKAWAHSRGLSQSDFSEMMGIYASHVAQTEAALAAVSRAEIAKAGVNAPQRVDAIGKWIRAEVGDADAKPILATLVTDSHLRFYEKLQQRITSQGAANFSTQHRVPPDDKAIPGYENMSFEQRRFAQDQIAARRTGR
jgi:hypothetical protein